MKESNALAQQGNAVATKEEHHATKAGGVVPPPARHSPTRAHRTSIGR